MSDTTPVLIRRRAQRLRRQAATIRSDWEASERREAKPGGLFGTYWRHGIVGRDEARMRFSDERRAALAHAADLEAAADALDRSRTGHM